MNSDPGWSRNRSHVGENVHQRFAAEKPLNTRKVRRAILDPEDQNLQRNFCGVHLETIHECQM
jgi:hypothetical protein